MISHPESPQHTHMHEHADKPNRTIMTPDLVKEHVAKAESVAWVAAKDLLAGVAESCIDGREAKGIIGVAGGNAGEFVLMVRSLEEVLGRKLAESEVEVFFQTYIEKFGKFYLHSDEHKLHALEAELAKDATFAAWRAKNPENAIEDIVRQCPTELQTLVLDNLTNPAFMGCGHLKLMTDPTTSEPYDMRPEIVKTMMRGFYLELWRNNSQVQYEVLPGDHIEGAVVFVTTEDEVIQDDTLIPTVSPYVDEEGNETSFFTLHPQATEYLRRKIVEEVVKLEQFKDELGELAVGRLLEVVNRRGTEMLLATAGTLAVDDDKQPLPMIDLKFRADRSFAASPHS